LSLLCIQVLIQNGELLTGGLCKKTLGASGGSLIHVIMMEHGPEAARAFLSQCQYLTNHWLLQHGMSIGIGDTVADATTMGAINDTINKVCHLDSRTTSCVLLACAQAWWRPMVSWMLYCHLLLPQCSCCLAAMSFFL
jgi:hypothetical protein